MASEEQRLVEEFHKATGSTVGGHPLIRDAGLRIELMREELDELEEAIYAGDIVAAAKEIADLLYVTHGTSVAFGLDMQPIFKEVHDNNMTKTTGPKRADGKQMKPDNYQKPDIHSLVSRQTSKKPKVTFTVAHPVNHGFTVLTTEPRASAVKAAREALEKARST